jgi:hypothetical protein
MHLRLTPAAPLPYTETRVPRGAAVKPMCSTERERHTEPRTRHCRDPSIEQLRDTAARSCPAPPHLSSQDEEIDHLRKEVERLQQDWLSIQHKADRIRLKCDHLQEHLDLAEEQLSSRRPQRREEPQAGYHPYPRPFARSSRDPSPPSLTTPDRARLHSQPSSSTRQSGFNPNSIPIPSSSMPGTGAGSSKGKGKAVEEPEKWDMAKGYENLEDDDTNDERTGPGRKSFTWLGSQITSLAKAPRTPLTWDINPARSSAALEQNSRSTQLRTGIPVPVLTPFPGHSTPHVRVRRSGQIPVSKHAGLQSASEGLKGVSRCSHQGSYPPPLCVCLTPTRLVGIAMVLTLTIPHNQWATTGPLP